MSGKLFIVATPIGNLDDITYRAVRTLREVDLIACEDTRNTKKLLTRYGIQNEFVSYHEHNEVQRSSELVETIQSGKSIALVSDAGTPCISDPGYRIVKLAAGNGIEIIAVPGPSALVSALSVSGISSDSFMFFGFFPRKKKSALEILEGLNENTKTAVFYESPKRIVKTLSLILDVNGNRNVSLSREITKMYEETLRGTVKDVIEELVKKDSIKGEFVIVLEGAGKKKAINQGELEKALKVFYEKNIPVKTAVDIYTRIFDMPKNKVYETALMIWNK